jgi:hypothetical protein
MQKRFIAPLLFIMMACGTEQNKSSQTETVVQKDAVAADTYSCPMRCEGEKTYSEAGTCPVCKMNLELVAVVNADSTDTHEH